MRSKQEKQLNNVDTIIGTGTIFNGDVESEASVRVDGTVSGKVTCKGDVVIGPDGKVEAEVKGRNITIAGTVKGNVITDQMLKVEATGKLMGDAQMSTLIIDEGGKFDGKSTMQSPESSNDQKQNKKEKNKNKKEKAS